MDKKNHTYLICASIIIGSVILGISIYNGLDILGQYINDGLRVIASNII